MSIRYIYKLAFGAAALGCTLLPIAAKADATCTGVLADKLAKARASGQAYAVQLTMHRENVKLVSYSEGFLSPNADGSFGGGANQLFSDRLAAQQPFNVNAADYLDLRLSGSGVLAIHYVNWNFDTTWDLSCKGGVLTSYIANFGVVTLTFRDQFPLIR
jgi:hypothetical protein